MTERERYLAALLFAKPDRVPFSPGHGRQSTLAAWHTQGLPRDVHDYHAHVRRLIGMPPAPAVQRVDPGLDFRMIPQFEEKVLERRPAPNPLPSEGEGGGERSEAPGEGLPDGAPTSQDPHPSRSGGLPQKGEGGRAPGTVIVQDWKGNVCEISDEFDVSYLRNAIDFVTRRWIKCPVESRDDWPDMARRYNPDDPARFPSNWPERARLLRDRTYPAGLAFPGPFWQLREWLGFEGLCLLLLDDPGFAQEMIDFWERFVTQLLSRVFAGAGTPGFAPGSTPGFVPDHLFIQEDMAYKEKPMIGPDMCRRFLLPCWRRWGELAKQAGVPIYEIDSDGYIGDLIPVWIEAGFNKNSPLEVAAGNDLPAYRTRYGTAMAYQGGIDKRAMAAGGDVIQREITRLKPVIDSGGYIPSCDHGIPGDVSWPNFVEYCRLLAKATGWL